MMRKQVKIVLILNLCTSLLKRYKNADIAYVNQESPLGGDDRPYHGFKRFNTPSSVAQDLVDTGFNFVNGSNNHAMDQGESGINNSIHTWDKFKDKVLFTGVLTLKKLEMRFQQKQLMV